MKRLLAAWAALSLLLISCGSTVTTQVVPIQTPLPAQEEAVYRVEDSDGNQIGRVTLSITTDGTESRLTQEYDFGDGKVDRSSVLVDRTSMRPRSSERTVIDSTMEYRTAAAYDEDSVRVTFAGERGERERDADISETAYDNLESLFLWRTIAMGAGESLSYVNIVVDPKRGTINRALGTIEVSGREEVKLPSGTVEAWRVDFRSAGVTNRAWYAVDGDHRLVKYDIQRGPTLVLEQASP